VLGWGFGLNKYTVSFTTTNHPILVPEGADRYSLWLPVARILHGYQSDLPSFAAPLPLYCSTTLHPDPLALLPDQWGLKAWATPCVLEQAKKTQISSRA
jgi:hypothetical protein